MSRARVCLPRIHLGFRAQPRFKPCAQIPQRERARRALREVGSAHVFESLLAENGAQAREVLSHAAENAKPILPIVDLEAFEGSETVVRLDVPGRVGAHAPSARRGTPHAFRRCERLHDGASNGPLKRDELHTATARAVSARKRLAFRASCELPEKKGCCRPTRGVSQCGQRVGWHAHRVSKRDRAPDGHGYRGCIS